MNQKPITAYEIVERNRDYWNSPEVVARVQHLNEVLEGAARMFLDILCGRVKAGWPTREDGGDIC